MGICCIKAAEGCAWMGNALPCHGKDQVVIDKPIRRHKWTPSEVQTIWRKTQSREHPEHTECLYCGDLLGGWDKRLTRWQIDHYVALEDGGSDTIDNVFAACIQCNSDKSDLTIEQFLASSKFLAHTSATPRRLQHRARRCTHMMQGGQLCASRGPCQLHR